jgi:AraC family transcriptional regulator
MFDSYSRTPPQQAAVLRARTARLPPPRAVRRAIEYMQANLAESVRLEDIAGAAGLSVFHFSRTFRHATGLAPHRYLIEARIVRVKTLLLESGESLASIAEEAGFSDQSHMSKVFRRLAGMTPKQFRDGSGAKRQRREFPAVTARPAVRNPIQFPNEKEDRPCSRLAYGKART